jgi:hypothetical protein
VALEVGELGDPARTGVQGAEQPGLRARHAGRGPADEQAGEQGGRGHELARHLVDGPRALCRLGHLGRIHIEIIYNFSMDIEGTLL